MAALQVCTISADRMVCPACADIDALRAVGMVWLYLVTLFGFAFAILSMAEMASMAPTSGGYASSEHLVAWSPG